MLEGIATATILVAKTGISRVHHFMMGSVDLHLFLLQLLLPVSLVARVTNKKTKILTISQMVEPSRVRILVLCILSQLTLTSCNHCR